MKLAALFLTATAALRLPRQMDNSPVFSKTDKLDSAAFVKPEYVTQPVTHFDESKNGDTWEQAFYVNDTFWTPGSDAPVFLCCGGEGPPIDGSAVQHSVHCNVAVEFLQETKALMFAIEHRYYGCHNSSSCPYDTKTGTAKNGALKYLSSREATADIANFHGFASSKWNLTPKNKWVTFGGSYPGMMASFARLKYPNLIHAAVASSAPVHAALDMPGYNDVTAQAYGIAAAGGSDECNSSIANGHAKIGQLMNTSDGRKKLQTYFPNRIRNPDQLKSRDAQANFAGNGVASFPSQSNDPTCEFPACNIKKICQIITSTNTTDDIAKLAALTKAQESWAKQGFLDSGEEKEEEDKDGKDTATTTTARMLDYWSYQTCNEFGFYQTCEVGSQCMYTQGLVLLADFTAMCPSEYGISVDQVAKNIDATNAFYGGVDPLGPGLTHNATRIMWPNGDVDPWHALSVLQSPADEKEMPTLMVSGASHHAWTHPSAPTDQASVVAARQTIRDQVTAWLKED